MGLTTHQSRHESLRFSGCSPELTLLTIHLLETTGCLPDVGIRSRERPPYPDLDYAGSGTRLTVSGHAPAGLTARFGHGWSSGPAVELWLPGSDGNGSGVWP